jgi:aspartate racemase
VIGGLGPQATLDFFAKVLANTPATDDQDHLHLLIDSNPQVPDRNAAVAGTGPSPAATLVAMAKRLERSGADFLVMPCNAAHAFAESIREAVAIPFVSIIEETRDEVVQRFPDARHVGVLASSGCVDAGLYQEAFAEHGIDVVAPADDDMKEFMQLIYRIKTGDRTDAVREAMRGVAEGLVQRGAQVIVGGCTEVPLVLGERDAPWPLVNSTDILVAKAIQYARGDPKRRLS